MLKKVLSYFLFCLGGLFLVAIFAASIAGVGYVFEKENVWWLIEPFSIAGAIALVLFLSVVVIYFYIHALRLLYNNRQIFGANKYSILISLGITCIFFSRPVLKVLYFPVDFFSSVLWLFQDILKVPDFPTGSSTAGVSKVEWLAQAGKFFSSFFRTFCDSFLTVIRALPFTEILIAIAVWAAIGWVFNAFVQHREEENRLKTLLVSNLKAFGFNRILLAVFIMIASYLSITSIVAIPWLMEIKVSDVEENKNLLNMLKECGSTQEIFDKAYPEQYGGNVDSALNEMEHTLDQLGAVKTSGPLDSLLRIEVTNIKNNYTAAISGLRENRITEVNKWKSIRSSAWTQEQRLIKNAQNVFVTQTTVPMGVQERKFYFSSMQNWLGYSVDDIESKMSLIMDIRNSDDLDMSNRIRSEITSLQNSCNLIIESKEDSSKAVFALNRLREKNPYEILTAMRPFGSSVSLSAMPESSEQSPTPPKPGQELGVLGLLSSWLLKARSFELTLIVGMFGFGLLGACLTFFITAQKSPDGNKAEFKIGGALIKGLSAAVIIFLSVKGGLMVLAVEKTQPNAYILFFACLIGAVFSSNVWEWAREIFFKKYIFQNQGNGTSDQVTQEEKSKK